EASLQHIFTRLKVFNRNLGVVFAGKHMLEGFLAHLTETLVTHDLFDLNVFSFLQLLQLVFRFTVDGAFICYHLKERSFSDLNHAHLKHLRPEGEEEVGEQGIDVTTVNVGVGQENDFREAQVLWLGLLTDGQTHGAHDVGEFLVLENFFNRSLRNVHRLPLKGNATLIELVSGRAQTTNRRVPFADEECTLSTVAALVGVEKLLYSLTLALLGKF